MAVSSLPTGRLFGWRAINALAGLAFSIGIASLPPSARAQYPDVDQNEPPRGQADTPAPAAMVPPPSPAAAGSTKPAGAELTEEEKAEREGRRACKAAICAAFHTRKPGDDVSCTVLKSFRKEQLDKMLAKAKASWPWGQVRCTGQVKLKRELLVKALTEDRMEAKLDLQQVTCTVDRGTEASAEIKLEFTPAVTFEKGKAVKAQANWGKLEAPTLVKAAMWPATATDNSLNVLGGTLVEDINDFIGAKCQEVKADWDGK